MADFTIKRNDLLPALEVVLRDADGNPVDLTNATSCVFHMRNTDDKTMKVTDGPCQFDSDRTTGKVTYAWSGTDTDTAASFVGEFQVTWSGGKIQTFPSIGYIDIDVVEDLA